jgi:hypothetical protein
MHIIKVLVDDPSYIKPSGKINIRALDRDTFKAWNEVSKPVKDIGKKINNTL